MGPLMDRLAAGDGSGLLQLLELLKPQLAKAYGRFGMSRWLEFDEYCTDLLLAVGDAWAKKKKAVDQPENWCRRVLRNKIVDLLRERMGEGEAVTVDEELLVDPAHDALEPAVADARMRQAIGELSASWAPQSRVVVYLTKVRKLSQAAAAKRIIEAQQVASRRVEQRYKMRELAGDDDFRSAKFLGLSDVDAALYSRDDAEWSRLVRDLGISPAQPRDVASLKGKVGNIWRKARFELHRFSVRFLPQVPPELRRIWLAMWSDEGAAPLGFRPAALRLGVPERSAWAAYQVASIHALYPVPWNQQKGRGK